MSTQQVDSREHGPSSDDEAANTLPPEQEAILNKAGEWQLSAGMPPFGGFETRADGKKRVGETHATAPNNNKKRQVLLTIEENGTLTVDEYRQLGERVYQRQVHQGSVTHLAHWAFEAVYASFSASGHQDKDLEVCLRKQGLIRDPIRPRSRPSGLAQRDGTNAAQA